MKSALNWIRDGILVAEFATIKQGYTAKSGKGVARRSGVFVTMTGTLSKEGFMVKDKFVTKKVLGILEKMCLEYLPTKTSG